MARYPSRSVGTRWVLWAMWLLTGIAAYWTRLPLMPAMIGIAVGLTELLRRATDRFTAETIGRWIAGVMIAFTYNISVDMGGASGLKGFTAAILGGFGNLPASMAGGVVLGVVENASAEIFSHEYKDIVAFAVIVLILLFKPSGLFARSGGARRI